MSFLSFTQTPNKNRIKKNMRKETDSFMARCFRKFSRTFTERASSFTSKASITVEASFSIAFFFMAVMCLVCLFEMKALQINVKSALHSAGKELAAEAYVTPILFPSRVEQKIVETVGAERLEKSMIVGGSNGIDCSASKMYGGTTVMDLCAYYQIEIPILIFCIPVIAREEIIRVKGWSGNDEAYVSDLKREMVYVTEHGTVYHKNLTCTYLDLSIQAVTFEQISELRNENGQKYYECEYCGGSMMNQKNVYITGQGERYHSSLECSGLSRNIYAVPLSDVYELGGCSKCVK